MFDFNRATARYQDKQLAAHIDQISRAQAAEWAQESRNEVLRAYYRLEWALMTPVRRWENSAQCVGKTSLSVR